MFELFVSLLPFILGSALLPIQIIIVILILNSPHQEVLKASAYVGGMTVMRLLLICGKCWVFILSAIGEIAEAELGQTASAIAFLGFVLLAEILLQLPILIKLVLPRQSKNLLASISSWLTHYNRSIVIGVSLVFGLIFLYQGLTGLLAF